MPASRASTHEPQDLPAKSDVIIIGGGPAGASAAIYTARADLSTLVIDKGLTVGALGVTGKISNYPGVPGPVTGADLLSTMRGQAESFGARFLTDRVVGNNDEALEEALYLTKFASEVHLVVQTSGPKATEHLVTAVGQAKNVRIHSATRLVSIEGENAVNSVRIASRDGSERDLAVSGVFVYLQGNRPITAYLMGQLETTPEGCLKVDSQMQTSAPGVFAVGDLLCTHVKQAVIAAADGVVAAVATEKFLNQRTRARVDWA
jgi:thioredoxin reductase